MLAGPHRFAHAAGDAQSVADMGVQPATVQAGARRRDGIARRWPRVHDYGARIRRHHSAGNKHADRDASDTGGGVVRFEVSVTAAAASANASGLDIQLIASGSASRSSRAVDDSGNIETPSAGVTITIAAPGGATTYSIWSPNTVAAAPDQDPSRVEIGVKFRSTVAGSVTGIRYYKFSVNTGAHVGSLWSSAGTKLATATFGSETATGWQQVNFTTPVAITANTTYVASPTPTSGACGQQRILRRRRCLERAADRPGGQRRWRERRLSIQHQHRQHFPKPELQLENYWVDVVFTTTAAIGDTIAPRVSAVTPVHEASGISPTSAITATFSEAIDASTINATTIILRDETGAGSGERDLNAATRPPR